MFEKKKEASEPMYQTIAKKRLAAMKAAKKAKGDPIEPDEDDMMDDGAAPPPMHGKHPAIAITIGAAPHGAPPFGAAHGKKG